MFEAKGRIPTNIVDEMKSSYLHYSMSVIVGRALPDVRDGLKPVHRRILFAMQDMKNYWNQSYKKSARVVGDVIGKYHPHGDAAVYDAVVRMAQTFSMRYMLVDGQGNFGSIDGDPPAAMRYTEIRMDRISSEILSDIDKDTVEFGPNYDDSLVEPLVLPSRVPTLLMNGSSGIAVGMATNIPPHNLNEIIGATIHLIKNPDTTIEDLMGFVPGPDFPTGGFICGRAGIRQAYETGHGIIKMRARAIIEKQKRTERESIVITEIPYQLNKTRLLEKIADLVRQKRIEGIRDLRDESDREGMRIVIDLKKDSVAEVILNQLFKLTPLQSSFGVIMRAIVGGWPRVLNLKDALGFFVDHRREVILRRTRFELKQAESRLHILEGLRIALDNIDAVIELIKKSANPKEAKQALMDRFGLSEIQSQAILDMRLQRLTGLERDKIMEEYRALQIEITRLKGILENESVLTQVIVDELTEIREKFGDERRTQIIDEQADISIEDMIAEEDVVVTVSHSGYIKRNAISLYRSQRRGGMGKTGMGTKEEDFVVDLFIASTHNYILIFTDRGRVFWLKVHEIPQGGRAAKGKAIVNLVNMEANEKIAAILPVREFVEGKYVVMATCKGVIKKTKLMAFSRPLVSGIIALRIEESDSLIGVQLTDGEQQIILATRNGNAIRFNEQNARPMGRVAYGVRGIRLSEDDEVVGMEVIHPGTTLLTVTERGFGKRSKVGDYRLTNRGGKGVITIKTTPRNGKVVSVVQVIEDDDIMIVTDMGKIIRMPVRDITVLGRNTQGVKLITLNKGVSVVAVARLVEPEDNSENGDENGDENAADEE